MITIVLIGADTQKRSLAHEVHGRHLLADVIVVPQEAACLKRLALVTLHSAPGAPSKEQCASLFRRRALTLCLRTETSDTAEREPMPVAEANHV